MSEEHAPNAHRESEAKEPSDLLVCPEKIFDSPNHVLAREDLSIELKTQILENWKANALQVVRADGEGMAPSRSGSGAPSRRIQDIDRALASLTTSA